MTITPEALERYKALKTVEDANLAVRAQLKEAKKAQKREQTRIQNGAGEPADPDFISYPVEAGESQIWQKPVVPAPPTTLCHKCQTPVYFYELQDPPTCLDCEIFPEKVSEKA